MYCVVCEYISVEFHLGIKMSFSIHNTKPFFAKHIFLPCEKSGLIMLEVMEITRRIC